MRIIIDIGHPGHVHLFRPFGKKMEEKGHQILFTCRQKEFETELLEAAGFQYKSFGKHYSSKSGKIWGLFKFNIQMLHVSLKFRPSLFLSHGSIYAAQVSWLLGKSHISLEDTGNIEQVRLYLPFSKTVLTSDIFPFDYGKKQIRYKGHHELAYLHPKYFKPDTDFKSKIGLSVNEKYILLRFVSWNATHDVGQKGISNEIKLELVNYLTKKFKVYISSEKDLPDEFKQYKIAIHPAQMHDALYHAELFIGEGTTMAMEAAILGTPSIYVNTLQYSNVRDLEKYGLLFSLTNDQDLMHVVNKIVSTDGLEKENLIRKEKLLSEKIDVTAFLVWFVENYPESFRIMKENPDYQNKFK